MRRHGLRVDGTSRTKQNETTGQSLGLAAADVGLHAALYGGTWRVVDPRNGFELVGGRRLTSDELRSVIHARRAKASGRNARASESSGFDGGRVTARRAA